MVIDHIWLLLLIVHRSTRTVVGINATINCRLWVRAMMDVICLKPMSFIQITLFDFVFVKCYASRFFARNVFDK